MPDSLLTKLTRARLTILAIVLVMSGLAILFFAQWLDSSSAPHWLKTLPLTDIGGGLFTTGLLTVLLDYVVGKLNEQRQTEQLRAVLKEQASVMRDAVIEGFAFNPEDLARVSTPETLDQIIENSLAIRLGDKAFAGELYTDIRDQAVKSVERWHDAKIDIRLSADSSPPLTGRAAPPINRRSGAQRLTVTIRQEYVTIPAGQTRRFASVSDSAEYRELTQDGSATFVWFTSPSSGVDAGSTEAFELVQFSVNGEEKTIRRSARGGGQTYTVNLGIPEAERNQPATLAFTYRLMPPAHNRWLHVDVEQPTRGIDVELDYSNTDIASVSMLDFIASSQKSIVSKSPPSVPGHVVGLEFDGWLMPKSGVAFVWTMKEDVATSPTTLTPTNKSKTA